ncbi:hypothetical protein LOZ53_006843 [Ophidiomyces ophidiicola]|uniref:uncharacterized protein n=1 Tax=Ophidiomyces ophidiicola TaxID=1387563 RepID=UPI0020C2BA1C|nr:uncharacterized protein LOZ57_005366 [Ophidiomyces ophidiicola]KAI1905980.1 hypothetical protein LOZ61_006865 [Ophidiomyces ophidiicola]KAI1919457.1 hypothetical protein LOZ60_006828 [Ophidiomyces ophidiicola]KAI1942342.1 hypothetical protein LOZ57_005366 [Ophidiomyces ophidiicola]KAI1945993.1 hypothetical protein LOZ59_006830 [Ophidiomyces ophidiicola]KAI1978467.1 hypothetical protein LOZ53_006843 [Ophidiomyces ophidiicola]
MAPWESFDITFSFSNNPYSVELVNQILANRKVLHNILFIDRLLLFLGIESASTLYPPKSIETLRKLHRKVISSSSPNHYKQSVIYYLLRDCQDASDTPRSLHFVQQCYLPQHYRLFIDGLWQLDGLEFRSALKHLTEPSLIPTFPDEILYALLTVSQDDALAVAYYISVSPPLTSSKVLFAYFTMLCRTRLALAFDFTRKQPISTRHALVDQMIISVLSIKQNEIRTENAMRLVNLPFDETEAEWFEDCLLRGKAKDFFGARETVLMRRISVGFLGDLGKLDSLGGRKIEGLNWDILRRTLQPSIS